MALPPNCGDLLAQWLAGQLLVSNGMTKIVSLPSEQAREQFEAVFQRKDYAKLQPAFLPQETANPIWIVDLLKTLNLVKTSSEAKRLLEEGAVHLDNETITDFKAQVTWKKGMIIKLGVSA